MSEHFELPATSGLPEEQKKENIEEGLYSNFIVSVSWTQGEDKTKVCVCVYECVYMCIFLSVRVCECVCCPTIVILNPKP